MFWARLIGSFGRISDDVAFDGAQCHWRDSQHPAGSPLFLYLDCDEQLLGGGGFLQGFAGAGLHVFVVSGAVDLGIVSVAA